MPTRSRKRTRFVPQIILGSAAAVSVIPAVAIVDCGGKVADGSNTHLFGVAATVAAVFEDSGSEDTGAPDAQVFSVGVGTVAASFDDSGEPDAEGFFVAATFDGGDASVHHHPPQDADVPDGTAHDGSDDSGEG